MKMEFKVAIDIPNCVLDRFDVVDYRPPLFNEQVWSILSQTVITCSFHGATVPHPILREKLKWPSYLNYDAICVDIFNSYKKPLISVRGFLLQTSNVRSEYFETICGVWRVKLEYGRLSKSFSLSSKNEKDYVVILVDIPGIERVTTPTLLLNPKHVRKD